MAPQAHSDATVLIVDDEFLICQTLKAALQMDGYRVSTAQNGFQALQRLRTEPQVHLILLNLMKPVTGGRAFMERVANDESTTKIPVVVVSASVERTLLEGNALCLRKAPDLDVLLETVAMCTLPAETSMRH